ncbi:hypothetical protein MNBD_GAMMA01-1011 [hydrothermal vent metagenome]|uniref:Uncharacterized protein n=1 Tax=hydrothermal vent metagenome TaxID=652676 RepID=A0A3B0V1M9_9ZZZZ
MRLKTVLGYVPINIKFNDRDQYYQAFMEFNSNGTTKIMQKLCDVHYSIATINAWHIWKEACGKLTQQG